MLVACGEAGARGRTSNVVWPEAQWTSKEDLKLTYSEECVRSSDTCQCRKPAGPSAIAPWLCCTGQRPSKRYPLHLRGERCWGVDLVPKATGHVLLELKDKRSCNPQEVQEVVLDETVSIHICRTSVVPFTGTVVHGDLVVIGCVAVGALGRHRTSRRRRCLPGKLHHTRRGRPTGFRHVASPAECWQPHESFEASAYAVSNSLQDPCPQSLRRRSCKPNCWCTRRQGILRNRDVVQVAFSWLQASSTVQPSTSSAPWYCRPHRPSPPHSPMASGWFPSQSQSPSGMSEQPQS